MSEIEDIHIDIRKRITELLEDANISVNKLEKEINVDQKTLHNQINSTTKISLLTIYELLKYFPHINPKWLLYGEAYKKYLSKEYTLSSEEKPATAEDDIFHLLRSYDSKEASEDKHFLEIVNEGGLKEDEKIVIPVHNKYAPLLPAGSYILINQIQQWRKFLEYGNIYFIELKDDRKLFAEIDGSSNPKNFLLKDINGKTLSCELPTSLIRNIWMAVRKTVEM